MEISESTGGASVYKGYRSLYGFNSEVNAHVQYGYIFLIPQYSAFKPLGQTHWCVLELNVIEKIGASS